jgi:RimJ/RimL family protein N-acetyltransferase
LTDVRNYSAVDVLRDGTPVTVRAIGKEDAKSILAAFEALDPESIYTRFFTFKKSLSDTEVRQLTEVDANRVAALVVTAGDRLIAGGRYVTDDRQKSAELAFLTGSAFRGRGLASLLLKHLIHIAREQRVELFEADVLAQNSAMLGVFRRCGLPMQTQTSGDVVHVKLSLS